MQILSFVFHLWPCWGHYSGTLNSWAKCAGNFQSMSVACVNLTELIVHWSVKVCSCIFNSIICWMPSGCYTGICIQLAAKCKWLCTFSDQLFLKKHWFTFEMTWLLLADRFVRYMFCMRASFVLRHNSLILRNCVGRCLVDEREAISARTWWVFFFPSTGDAHP